MVAVPFIVTGFMATAAVAGTIGQKTDPPCGVPDLTGEERRLLKRQGNPPDSGQSITIPVVAHFCCPGGDCATKEDMEKQVQLMNDRFSPAQIRFNLQKAGPVQDTTCLNMNLENVQAVNQYKASIHEGGEATLNLLYLPSNQGAGLKGVCNIPRGTQDVQAAGGADGCAIAMSTLPGGSDTQNGGPNPNGGSGGPGPGGPTGGPGPFGGLGPGGPGSIGNDPVSNDPIGNLAISLNGDDPDSSPIGSGSIDNEPGGLIDGLNLVSRALRKPHADLQRRQFGQDLTLVTIHEVGHWFGLEHRFEGGAGGNFRRQAGPGSCNIMDYKWCQDASFDPDQLDNMRSIATTRMQANSTPPDGSNGPGFPQGPLGPGPQPGPEGPNPQVIGGPGGAVPQSVAQSLDLETGNQITGDSGFVKSETSSEGINGEIPPDAMYIA